VQPLSATHSSHGAGQINRSPQESCTHRKLRTHPSLARDGRGMARYGRYPDADGASWLTSGAGTSQRSGAGVAKLAGQPAIAGHDGLADVQGEFPSDYVQFSPPGSAMLSETTLQVRGLIRSRHASACREAGPSRSVAATCCLK